MPIQEEDVVIFWRKPEIGSDIPKEHHRDMESKMRELISLLQEISTGPISNVREVRRLIKGVIHPVLPDDPCQPLSIPPETAVTKGRRRTNFTKRDKSHWKYVSIAHRKIGKSSSSGSGSNPSPRGRGRAPRGGRSRGRGHSSGRSNLSTIVSPDSPPVPFSSKNAFPEFTYQFIRNWKNVVGDGNCGFRVLSNFLFRDQNHWVEIRRRMSYDLRHHMHELPGHYSHWEYSRDSESSGECKGVSAKVPRARVPPQKCSSRHTSCYSVVGVPLKAGWGGREYTV
ncbi:hypothetical protein M9H77_14922 [Catharanthus roseus]|uniref:Uncharacterized protein n=1 Tax=Catharanthus roseus TaxID=4058 RepID=A0ACC0BPJ4_CATRO|nr:hypothetical protein M9H77_14922 [Catharanthus roseus]